MKKNKINKGITAVFVLIALIVVSGFCSASVSVVVNTDKSVYFPGEVVKFTSTVAISGEGACLLDAPATLKIHNGNSKTCYLPDADGISDVSFCGDCTPFNWVNPPCIPTETSVNIKQTHATDCLQYGGNNTYTYKINWTIPLNFTGGNYTAEMEANFSGNKHTNTTKFTIPKQNLSDETVNIIDPQLGSPICAGKTTTITANVIVNATNSSDPRLGNVSVCFNITCPGSYKINIKRYVNLKGTLSSVVNFSVTPPSVGVCNVSTCVDCDNTILETNENDNCDNITFKVLNCAVPPQKKVPISPIAVLAVLGIIAAIAVSRIRK